MLKAWIPVDSENLGYCLMMCLRSVNIFGSREDSDQTGWGEYKKGDRSIMGVDSPLKACVPPKNETLRLCRNLTLIKAQSNKD